MKKLLLFSILTTLVVSSGYALDFTITIPDNQKDRVIDAVCGRTGYDEESGLTKGQWTKRWIIRKVKNEVKDYEAERDANKARQDAIDKVNNEVTIQ